MHFFNCRFVSLTFDGWTSGANNSFLAVTGHFLPTGTCTVESVVLCLIDSSMVAHSGVEYAAKIRCDVTEKLKFAENNISIVCATTDNAANMLTTAENLKIKHMPCYTTSFFRQKQRIIRIYTSTLIIYE